MTRTLPVALLTAFAACLLVCADVRAADPSPLIAGYSIQLEGRKVTSSCYVLQMPHIDYPKLELSGGRGKPRFHDLIVQLPAPKALPFITWFASAQASLAKPPKDNIQLSVVNENGTSVLLRLRGCVPTSLEISEAPGDSYHAVSFAFESISYELIP